MPYRYSLSRCLHLHFRYLVECQDLRIEINGSIQIGDCKTDRSTPEWELRGRRRKGYPPQAQAPRTFAATR